MRKMKKNENVVAHIKNKLQYPRSVLEVLLKQKNVYVKEDIRTSVEELNVAVTLLNDLVGWNTKKMTTDVKRRASD